MKQLELKLTASQESYMKDSQERYMKETKDDFKLTTSQESYIDRVVARAKLEGKIVCGCINAFLVFAGVPIACYMFYGFGQAWVEIMHKIITIL